MASICVKCRFVSQVGPESGLHPTCSCLSPLDMQLWLLPSHAEDEILLLASSLQPQLGRGIVSTTLVALLFQKTIQTKASHLLQPRSTRGWRDVTSLSRNLQRPQHGRCRIAAAIEYSEEKRSLRKVCLCWCSCVSLEGLAVHVAVHA